MILDKFKVTTSVSINIDEYEKFYLIDGGIYNKKVFEIIGVDPRKLSYNKLTQLLSKKLIYALVIPEERMNSIEESVRLIHTHNERHNTAWFDIPKFIQEINDDYNEKDTEKQLIEIDEKYDKILYYFNWRDHSLWDYNFNRVSLPIHLEYMNGGISNKAYKLKELREHILNLPDTLVKVKSVSEIWDIPYYNREDGRDKYLNINIILHQDAYNEFCENVKRIDTDNDDKFVKYFGMYYLEMYKREEYIKELLGFNEFKKIVYDD